MDFDLTSEFPKLVLEMAMLLLTVGIVYGTFKAKHDQAISQLREIDDLLKIQQREISTLHQFYVTHAQLEQVLSQLKEDRQNIRQEILEIRSDIKQILRLLVERERSVVK